MSGIERKVQHILFSLHFFFLFGKYVLTMMINLVHITKEIIHY